MTSLIRAELLRLRSRRLTWIALVAVLLAIAATQIAVVTSVRPLTAAEQAQGQEAFARAQVDYEQNKAQYEEYEQECLDQGSTPDQCDYHPKLENYVARNVSTYAEVADLSVTVSVFVTGLALLLVSAALIGGDFTSGSMSNWLSFVPQRTKVFGSKAIALVGVGALTTALTSALAVGATTLLTRVVGSPVVGLADAVADGARGIALGVIATMLGFGIAMLTRHTIAAAGTVLGYLFASFGFGIVMDQIYVLQNLKRYLPETNAIALLQHGTSYSVITGVRTEDGSFAYMGIDHALPFSHSVVYWVIVVVVVLTSSFLALRRRDLT